jgi:preprotein translocase subunit SecD
LGCPFGAFATSASCQQRFPVLHANQTRSSLQIATIEILSAQSLSSETARLPRRFSMTQTIKLIVSLIIFFFIFVNLVVLAVAALPLVKVLQGDSTRLGFKLVPESGSAVSAADIEKAIAVIGTRLDRFGVTSAVVERSEAQGEHLAVSLPPVDDLARIKAVIGYSGLLELKPLAKGTQVPYPTKEAAEKAAKEMGGDPYEVLKFVQRYDSDNTATEGWVVIEKTPVVTGLDMRDARATSSQYNSSNYQIDFSLTPEGAARISKWTSQHVGEHLAIILNREVRSAPMISGQINDRGQITGGFTKQSAENLAITLGSGTLPHKLELVSEQLVSSKSLAQQHIIQTGLSGLSLVALIAGFIYHRKKTLSLM